MISLFTTFFLNSENPDRQEELLFCLNENVNNTSIKKIYLFLDGKNIANIKQLIAGTVPTDKIVFLNVRRIPTYGDWIMYSRIYADELSDISVFANADIYMDKSITQIAEYLKHPESIVCLSRHNVEDHNITPHPNPQWSQDLWAISKENILTINNSIFINELNVYSTGLYRCDNKLAYLFAMRGWTIYNPFPSIKCFHLQKSSLRAYGKFDSNVVGGLCFPAPTDSPSKPSDLDISVMPVKVGGIIKCSLNKYLYKNLWL